MYRQTLRRRVQTKTLIASILLASSLCASISPCLAAAAQQTPAAPAATSNKSVAVSSSVAPTKNAAPAAHTVVLSADPKAQSAMVVTAASTPESKPDTAAVAKRPQPTADQSTGALVYAYPIAIPPGRNGVQPDVSLTYNSQAAEEGGEFGYGWSASIPSIQRVNRSGSDHLYTQNVFTSSLSGELVATGAASYGAKIENGEFLHYAFSNNSWVVTDKKGTTYTFGATAASRQDDASSSDRVYAWMLNEIRDTNNNFVRFEYFKDAGQIYPSEIVYTGNGTTDGIFEIDFGREGRTDAQTSYKTGFAVKTNFRINQIQTKVRGVAARMYALAYASGANGARSLLESITESGRDARGNVTTLPPTNFTYQKNTPGFAKTAWTWPMGDTYPGGPQFPPLVVNADRKSDQGVQFVDVNGDGLPDIVQSGYVWGSRQTHIYLNTGHASWVESTTWKLPNDTDGLPLIFVDNSGYYRDMGVRFADVNGDGLPDIIQSRVDFNWTTYTFIIDSNVYINNGVNGWVKSATWKLPINYTTQQNQQLPVYFCDDRRNDSEGVEIVDVNGDGLPDIVQAGYIFGARTAHIYLNKGDNTGWAESASWTLPNDVDGGVMSFVYPQSNGTYPSMGIEFADVNGDGLPDLVESRIDTVPIVDPVAVTGVFINNGVNGWVKDSNWVFPINYTNDRGIQLSPSFSDQDKRDTEGLRILDINGDGLPDLVQSGWIFGTRATHIYLNNGNGTGWTESTDWTLPNDVDGLPMLFIDEGHYRDLGVRFVDTNGDGMVDIVRSRGDMPYFTNIPVADVFLNAGSPSDALTRLTYPQGGHSDIGYKATPQYVNGVGPLNPKLPLVITTVNSITDNAGVGASISTTFLYVGASYYYHTPFDRKFAGFATITKTDATGAATRSYFHQGNGTNAARGEYQDDAWKIGKVYRTENVNGAGTILSKTISKWDDTDLGHGNKFVKLAQKIQAEANDASAESYSYDASSGNPTERVQWGRVAATDSGTFTDVGVDKLVTDYTYTNVPGLVADITVSDQSGAKVRESRRYYDSLALGAAVKGNLTKDEEWKSGTAYANTQKSYDGIYGLVTSSTDPRGKVTTIAYDTDWLYPTAITNPLKQTDRFAYDAASGQLTQRTDANGAITKTTYDGLGRVLEVDQPDGTPTTTYSYNDARGVVSVEKSNWLDAATHADTYTYVDGLGRPIQTRAMASGANFAVSDVVYNAVGLVAKQSLPYFSAGSAMTAPSTVATLFTTYTYDPLRRVTAAVDANGTTATAYNGWTRSVTDANGHATQFINDAYGNLVEVDEHNGAATYATQYTYDAAGDLTHLTDAASNVRDFSYDGLGHHLTATDLHAPADTTFGVWSYVYDDAGNPTTTVDANHNTITDAYDPLGRMTTESLAGHGVQVTNVYDTCPNGIGRLCAVTNAAEKKSFAYDAVGRVATETAAIASTTYATSHAYDRQGHETLLTNPDGSQVQYAYAASGALDRVQMKEKTAAAFTDIVTHFDYSPLGQVTDAKYAAAETVHAYDAAHRYRLSSTLTTIAGGVRAQDVRYAYDPVGNITGIVDASATPAAKTVAYGYDDLNRLTSAVATGQSPYAETYAYDPIGNLTFKTGQGSYAYAGAVGASTANPHAATTIGGVALTYDANGNVLTQGPARAYAWDYANRLTKSVVGAATTTYAYDATGERATLTAAGVTTAYPMKTYNVTASVPTLHIFAAGADIASVQGTGAAAKLYPTFTDHLTGASVVTDASGKLVESLDYLPYGGVRADAKAGAYSEQRKFAGHEYDAASGLEYMDARYYDPAVGRFLSEDPAFLSAGYVLSDPQLANSYSYARNNPLTMIDPDGRNPLDIFFGFANAFVSNNGFGMGRIAPQSYNGASRSDYASGQAAGDFTSMLTGTAEAVFGGTIAGAGLGAGAVLAPVTGGVSVMASAAAVAQGAFIAGHGVSAAALGQYNFLKGRSGEIQSQQSNSEIANTIANGHAVKHIPEFDWIKDIDGFALHIQKVMDNPSEVISLEKGRTAYWENKTGTLVIHDPSTADKGTAFRPTRGYDYVKELH